MHLAKKWTVSGLMLLIAATASAQSAIAIPKPSKTPAPGVVTPWIPPRTTPSLAPPMPVSAVSAVPASTAAVGSVTYTYDSLGRLIQDAYPTNTASYTYDAAGNRTASQTQ